MNGRRFLTPATLTRVALPALAAALLLSGCGGSSSAGAGSTTSPSASSTSTAKLSAFQSCLKQHGVSVNAGAFGGRPRGSFSPGARPTAFPSGARPTAFPSGSAFPRGSFSANPKDSAAFKACAKYAPAGFGGGFGGRGITASALAAFKSCLAQNGVKVTGKTAPQILGQLRNATGKTAAAVKTCRVLIQPTPTTSPSPSPSS